MTDTKLSQHFKSNFFKDYIMCSKYNIIHDPKNEVQKNWEKFLINRGIMIGDYQRIIKEQKYFEVITNITMMNKKKLLVLYNPFDLSYRFGDVILYKYNIPKNSTEKQFENIYNFLVTTEKRTCFVDGNEDPFFFCVHCGSYYCKNCIYDNLKWVLVGGVDIGYFICKNCGKFLKLYSIPSHFTV